MKALNILLIVIMLGLFIDFSYALPSNFTDYNGLVVDPKNGNLSLRVVDVSNNIDIAKTYNSMTSFRGLFGDGWCSNLETSVTELPEGNLLITQCGAGQTTVYGRLGQIDNNIIETSKNIAEEVSKKSTFKSKSEKQNYIDKLKLDPFERRRIALELQIPFLPNQNVKLYKNGLGPSFIQRNETGYRLTEGSTITEFDKSGRLLSIGNKNNNYFLLKYIDNKLTEVSAGDLTSSSRIILDQKGKIKKIGEIEYRYRDGLLVFVMSQNGIHSFEYDDKRQIKKILLPNLPAVNLTINSKTKQIEKVIYADNCIDEFNYGKLPDNKKGLKTTRHSNCRQKEGGESETYEYWVGVNKAQTQKILLRSRVNKSNEIDDIHYHPLYQTPVKSIINNTIINYKIDLKGIYTGVNFEGNFIKLSHDPVCEKISTYVKNGVNIKFTYNSSCNVMSIEDSEGKKYIKYDEKGRIAALANSKNENSLLISYDDKFGKPSILEAIGLGKIKVSYKDDGSIDKSESEDDYVVARKVARKLNSLIELIKLPSDDLPGLSYSEFGKNCSCSFDALITYDEL